MDIMQLRRSICYIPQEDFIVNGSIEDNVLLYEKGKNNIRSALNDAMLSEYDNGETHNICDGGISISGGERRRIMLARAFMTNASVIILDEPTTGLDSNTEKQVIKNIKKRFKDRLVIIISHSEEVLKSGDIRLRMADQNLIKV